MKTITVAQLKNILRHLPDDLSVWLTLPTDELPIACVTKDRRSVHLCSSGDEISIGETVLFALEEADEFPDGTSKAVAAR